LAFPFFFLPLSLSFRREESSPISLAGGASIVSPPLN
jgi:hypothetical protein